MTVVKLFSSIGFRSLFPKNQVCPVVPNERYTESIELSNLLNDREKKSLQIKIFKDLWGFEIDWTKSEEGWDLLRRQQYVILFELYIILHKLFFKFLVCSFVINHN